MNVDGISRRRWTAGVRALALALGVTGAALPAADPFVWQYGNAEEAGVDSAQLARLLLEVQRDGIALHSFILVRHDRIVAEAYVYPYTATTRHPLYSVSKSFTSAILGIAIQHGLVRDVNERVVDVFQGVTNVVPSVNLSRMTLRHLLTMSTGHARDTTARITSTGDWVKAFLELPVENPPGAPFVYNSGATVMLSAAIQRRAGVNAATYGRTYLFDPLGITDWTWDVGPNNVTTGGWGLALRPLDMAKFGLLYLHNGVWNGQQIVPAAWVAESGRKQVENGPSGTFWESGYGYQFWLNDFGGDRADGALGQYIFILPAFDAVVVFTANLPNNGVPGDLVRTYVIPAFQPGALPANGKANALVTRYGDALGGPPLTPTAAPWFTAWPADQVALPGGAATFTVGVTGNPAPAVQWYHDGVAIAGATGSTLTMETIRPQDAGAYHAVATNAAGQLSSLAAHLTLDCAPEITRAPVAQCVAPGDDVVFQVEAVGGNLHYAWRHAAEWLAGADTPMLRLAAVRDVDAGEYVAVVTNARGTVSSEPAALSIAPPDPASALVNVSIRAQAGAGDQTLIVGFTVAGANDGPGLPVLLRGIGPTLAALRVNGFLADPAIVLHAGSTPGAVNADWCGDPLLAEVGERVGAFALPRASDDAALRVVLTPRTYTVHVTSSLPGLTGVALGECYDAAGHRTRGGPRLVNLSGRALVTAGEGTLIAGFVISGAEPMLVLVRGIGPALAQFHVDGVLPDPELRLFDGDAVIATNDDWAGEPALHDAFLRTGAFALPDDGKDAALLARLAPGVYTAHVTGRAGATGVALVEVYAVPE